MKKYLLTVFVFILLSSSVHLGARPPVVSSSNPNIIFVMADDLGSWILSSEGYPNTHTPNLDRLADEGVVLENAFSASAVCSPSRGAFLSSRYPSENGVTDNVVDDKLPGLHADLVTWPQVLQDSGYNTLMVGKWHLGEGRDVDMPTSRGYTEFAGFLHGGRQSKELKIDFLKPGERTMAEVTTVDYETVPGDQFTPDLLGDLSIDLIKKYHKEQAPFCLSLYFWAPHANTRFPEGYEPPYNDRSWLPMQDVDQAFWKRLSDEDIKLPEPDFPNLNKERTFRMLREYHSSIHAVDRNVGRLMNLLDDLEIAGNTVFVFTSDHGYMMGHHGMWHKGNGRWLTENKQDPSDNRLYGDGESRINLFDNSMRVPCVIRWPERLEAGSRVKQTFSHLDWFPTLAAMAQAALPAKVLIRGNNALPLLEGKVTPIWNNDIFGQYLNLRTYRTHEWKLVLHYGNRKGDEFYNLVNDPDEKMNLIGSSDFRIQEALEVHHGKLTTAMVKIHDPYLSK